MALQTKTSSAERGGQFAAIALTASSVTKDSAMLTSVRAGQFTAMALNPSSVRCQQPPTFNNVSDGQFAAMVLRASSERFLQPRALIDVRHLAAKAFIDASVKRVREEHFAAMASRSVRCLQRPSLRTRELANYGT